MKIKNGALCIVVNVKQIHIFQLKRFCYLLTNEKYCCITVVIVKIIAKGQRSDAI